MGNLLITSFFIVSYKRIMKFAFPVVWCYIGYASKGERVAGELWRTSRTPYYFGSVEVGSFMFNAVLFGESKRCSSNPFTHGK